MSSEYDLTPTMGPYLDAHLLLPLLDNLKDAKLYSEDEVIREKINVISRTNMTDLKKYEEHPGPRLRILYKD